MTSFVIKAALCAAFSLQEPETSPEREPFSLFSYENLTVECQHQNNTIRLQFSTTESGQIELMSRLGNRMSSTIGLGSRVIYVISKEQFPVTVLYRKKKPEDI